jgi:hypothetical protein
MYCPQCNQQVPEGTARCPHCKFMIVFPALPMTTPYAQPPIESDPVTRMLLPVGRSPWAIAAGYLGLVSVLFIFAPFALACGVMAIIDIRKHPDRHGMGRAIFGVVMGAIFSILIIVFLVIGIIEQQQHGR